MKPNSQAKKELEQCWLLPAFVLLSLVSTTMCQTLDTFDPVPNGSVAAMILQPNGMIVVGGNFTTLGGQTRNKIGRLGTDGVLDSAFNPVGPGPLGLSQVFSLALQTDGRIMVGGFFTSLNGQPRLNFGRLNPNGTLDSAFSAIAGGASGITSLAIQADGKILIGGGFTLHSGLNRTNIARFNANGTLDTAFNPGANAIVYTLAVQPDGKIVAGGQFTSLGGQVRSYLGRLNPDGTPDTNFNSAAGGFVYSLAVQGDGKILVGGAFTTLGGQTRNRIGRLNTDGTPDMDFNPGVSGSQFPSVYSFALQSDGKTLVGGSFTNLAGQTRRYIGRLNANGTLDATFNLAVTNPVLSVSLQADGKILIGGSFTNVAGQTRNRIARLNNTEPATQSLTLDGSTVAWLRHGTSPEVWHTNFEFSTNNVDWVSLGEGTRISGGWQLTGLSAPPNSNIRARGLVTGGEYNGSSWFVESTTRPIILVNDGNFGIRSNQFGFNISATIGQTFVVEASTNLTDWNAIVTNTSGMGPTYFSDSDVTIFPSRLYRVRLE